MGQSAALFKSQNEAMTFLNFSMDELFSDRLLFGRFLYKKHLQNELTCINHSLLAKQIDSLEWVKYRFPSMKIIKEIIHQGAQKSIYFFLNRIQIS